MSRAIIERKLDTTWNGRERTPDCCIYRSRLLHFVLFKLHIFIWLIPGFHEKKYRHSKGPAVLYRSMQSKTYIIKSAGFIHGRWCNCMIQPEERKRKSKEKINTTFQRNPRYIWSSINMRWILWRRKEERKKGGLHCIQLLPSGSVDHHCVAYWFNHETPPFSSISFMWLSAGPIRLFHPTKKKRREREIEGNQI